MCVVDTLTVLNNPINPILPF